MSRLAQVFDLPDSFTLSDAEIAGLRAEFADLRCYALLFTARSGSRFLGNEIARAGSLGVPREWFNPDVIRNKIKPGETTPVSYIRQSVLNSRSRNRVFAAELTWPQLTHLNRMCGLQELFQKRVRWALLRRRNLVAQAISIYVASQTKVFHSFQLGKAQTDLPEVAYDAAAISNHLTEFIAQERQAIAWLQRQRVMPVLLYYEDVVSRPQDAVFSIANLIGARVNDSYFAEDRPNPIEKLGGELNLEFEARFRAENSDFLQTALTTRPPVLNHATRV